MIILADQEKGLIHKIRLPKKKDLGALPLNALKQILYDTTDCLLATTNMIFLSEMFNINKYVETQV